MKHFKIGDRYICRFGSATAFGKVVDDSPIEMLRVGTAEPKAIRALVLGASIITLLIRAL